MTQAEFSPHMGRLIEQFGKGAYSQARVEIIWRSVRDMDAHWWSMQVDRFLGECRQAPLVPEIRDAVLLERNRAWQAKKQQGLREEGQGAKVLELVRCRACRDLGYVRATLRANPVGCYAFRCTCDAGRASQLNFPPFADVRDEDYEVIL